MKGLLSGAFLPSLSPVQAAFFWIGVLAGVILFAQILLSAVGDFRFRGRWNLPVSLKSVTAFFFAGGFCAFFTARFSPVSWLPYPVFVFAGAAAFAICEPLVRLLGKKWMEYRKNRFTGADGIVILPVPPARKGKGKVTLLLSDDYDTVDAVTDEEESIPAGTPVRIVFYYENFVLVNRLEKTKIGKAETIPARECPSESGSGVHSE